MDKTDETVWFAMRATYRRELDAKQLLDQQSIENFIPMHYRVSIKNKQKKRELVPVVRNLLFVRSTLPILNRIKETITWLQFMTEMKEGRKVPLIVPDLQMRQFIAVAGTYDEQLIYLKPEELNLTKGTKVRINGGVFDGQEGIFVKVKGARDKRVVVCIQGIIAVATTVIHPGLLEVIK